MYIIIYISPYDTIKKIWNIVCMYIYIYLWRTHILHGHRVQRGLRPSRFSISDGLQTCGSIWWYRRKWPVFPGFSTNDDGTLGFKRLLERMNILSFLKKNMWKGMFVVGIIFGVPGPIITNESVHCNKTWESIDPHFRIEKCLIAALELDYW